MVLKTIKIDGYDINSDDVWMYIQHFGKDRSNLNAWEKMRRALHDYIFENLNLDRHSDEGLKFGKQFDAWAEPHILKYDPISAKAKRLATADTDTEIEASQMMLKIEIERQKMLDRSGGRNFTVNDKNFCRICDRELVDCVGRMNDHLMCPTGFDPIDAPICLDCAHKNPDEYHIAFKKQSIQR
ncbi:hypothetical protein GQ472_01915 [archaeon]|nr:hypothetical protein [archaeon]